MKAAYYEQLGNAQDVLKIGEIDIPELGANDVLVKVRASGVNPSDVKQRSGWGGLTMRHPRVIPHNDGAGIIEAAGEGVQPSRIGERVWIYEATLIRPFGTAAEYVVVPSEQAVLLPENTDFAAGACLGVPAMTAHHCVFKDGAVAGKMVLVAGGAGAVGNYAIQLAKWGGATVISTVSSAEKAEIAKTAGADYIVNYKAEDVAARLKEITGGKGVDRIIEVDFAGNLEINLKAIARNGTIATYASDSDATPQIPVYSLMYKNLTVHYVLVYAMDSSAHQQAAADITTCLKAGVLHHAIAQRFALDEIAAAHELQESGRAVGNLVLVMN
ncbi:MULTISPECIES: NADPH:quinone reductase [unclassified Microcoleus]|uniref:NADPH:quinone reductase n=1 Tax=unclassified Microcoleus TaxID=2642155 RepID=UPI002FD3A1C7